MGASALAAISAVVAVFSCAISFRMLRISRSQADLAAKANDHAKQIGHGQAVIHFSSRYFDLMNRGPRFDDAQWMYQLWSLHSTEFYFFHMGWLPEFMYELWMAELASTYRTQGQVWTSHEKYLSCYSANYPEMWDFFCKIHEFAIRQGDNDPRPSAEVQAFVRSWRKTVSVVGKK
jgi:hypothetical protein